MTLTNTVWRQYNKENDFREMIARYCSLEPLNIIEDDKALYAVLKSKLTKRELKLFAMDSANMDDEAIKDEFGYDDDDLQKAKYKLYKKLKQDKTRLAFRATSLGEEEF